LDLFGEARPPGVEPALAGRRTIIPDLPRPEPKAIIVACHDMTIGCLENTDKRSMARIGMGRRKGGACAAAAGST